MDQNARKLAYEEKRRSKEAAREARQRRRKFRSYAIWGGGGLAVVIALTAIIMQGGPNFGSQTALFLHSIAASDQVTGNASSSVVLVEYGDYQCPACRMYHPVVEEIVREFSPEIAVVYRHFPLQAVHPKAFDAAKAAEAAGLQGKFWEMNDLLYERQGDWSSPVANARDKFTDYARTLGLNVDRWSEAFNSDAIAQKVSADYSSGVVAGVQGTPTFFLDGVRINPRPSVDDFRALIREALDRTTVR